MNPRFAIVLILLLGTTSTATAQHPYDWVLVGADRTSYMVDSVTSSDTGYAGKWDTALHLKMLDSKPHGFGAIRQHLDVGDYRGQRIRMTAMVRTKDVSGWAGMWIRADRTVSITPYRAEVVSFDNMCNRPLVGTNFWNEYSMVVDVPVYATDLYFGVLLSPDGPKKTKTYSGEVWLTDVRIQVVDRKTPVTDVKQCASWAR